MAASAKRASYDSFEGVEQIDKMIAIDQSPIGRTPRSNPGTYIKLFDEIRKLYTQLPEAKTRGYAAGAIQLQCQRWTLRGVRRQRFQQTGNGLPGRCLGDLPGLQGQRFNRETLQVKFRDKSIADVLEMDIQEAMEFFENIPKVFTQTGNAARRRIGLSENRTTLTDAVRRRSPTNQTGPRTGQTQHRQDAVHAGRTDDRFAFCRHLVAAEGPCRILSRRATPCWSSNTIST